MTREMTMEERADFESDEMEFIGSKVQEGYYSGITPWGSTWSIEINFDYDSDYFNEED